MPRDSAVIESAGKWAPAEEILGNQATVGGVPPALPSSAQLSLQNGHADPRTSPNQPANAQSTSSGTGRHIGQVANGPIPPPPPPPPLPSSQGPITPSQLRAPTNSHPEVIELIPVRRASPALPNPYRQSQVLNSVGSNARQSNTASSTFISQPYPPPVQYHTSPASASYTVQLSGQPTYPGTPSGSQTIYQDMRPPTTPQMFSSPAPMSHYIASPGPATFSGQASYPGPQPQYVRANSFPPPQSVGTSPMYLPSGQSATQSYRPLTTPSMQTPQSVYGGASQSYRPQTVSTPVQSMSGPSQQPLTPGAPIMASSNIPQIPGIIPAPNQAPKTPNRTKTDAFVANDPFRRQSYGKHQKNNDDITFDDIQTPGLPSTSAPMPIYSSAPVHVPSSSYTMHQSQPPIYGGSQSKPQSAPPASGSYSAPAGYYRPPDNQTPSWGTTPRPSQGGEFSQPGSQVPNGAQRPSTPGQPQGPLRPITPVQADHASQLPAPAWRPSTDEIVSNQPADQPAYGAPSQAQPTYGTHSPPPSPPPGQQFPYSPTSGPYVPERTSWYDPYIPQAPQEQPVFAAPSDSTHYVDYYPNYDFPRPAQAYKASFLSRIGNFLLWPFSRRRKGAYEPPANTWEETSFESKAGFARVSLTFVGVTLPRQVYLHFLLRLPALYFSRVARIFEEADLTLPEIKKMALETASQTKGQIDVHTFESSNVHPQYERLKSTWESFIDSVMREWKTFNIISVLLLSAILTILQIPGAGDDPVTRYTALFSLICALISLLFGCMYIIRFGSMRKTYKAAEWALEAKRTKTVIWWNVWVLLAMPAIWLTWSILLYIVCIMSFVWRSSSQDNGPPIVMSKGALLTIRIVITTVLGLGIIYGWLILSTFSRYGEAMDRAWKTRIDGWIEEKAQVQPGPYPYSPYLGPTSYQPAQYTPFGDDPYSGYSQQAVPAYTDYGYSNDTKNRADFGPTYASASYVPPPEPYDSPVQSRAGSPQSTSSTLDITRSNTHYNKISSVPLYNHPVYPTQNPLPLPPKISVSPSDIPPRVPKKTPLAVPPPPSLPPIPGTPATAFADTNSTRSSSSIASARFAGGLGIEFGDRDDDSPENRVRFRSPLESAQGSFFAESDGGAGSPPQPSADASGLSVRLSPTPDSVEPGQDSDSLRRRR